MTESALARPFLIPSSQGGVQGGENRGLGGFSRASRDPFGALLALRRFQNGQRGLQDGLRQSKMDPRRPKAPLRLSRWLQGASQTAQDGPKIDENP